MREVEDHKEEVDHLTEGIVMTETLRRAGASVVRKRVTSKEIALKTEVVPDTEVEMQSQETTEEGREVEVHPPEVSEVAETTEEEVQAAEEDQEAGLIDLAE